MAFGKYICTSKCIVYFFWLWHHHPITTTCSICFHHIRACISFNLASIFQIPQNFNSDINLNHPYLFSLLDLFTLASKIFTTMFKIHFIKKIDEKAWFLNPLTPRSDSHVTSPYNIDILSSKQVMRILKCIR